MIDDARIARLTAAQRRLLARRLRRLLPDRAAVNPRLVAYVQSAPECRPEPAELRRHLAAHVPEYMIPSDWVFLPALPRLPSGKLDRQAVRALDCAAAPRSDVAFAPPTDELEQGIARIWRELLCRERVGVQDNFFDLGGHSLLLVRLQSRLRDILGLDVTVMDLFRYPTIKAIANATRANGRRAPVPSIRHEAAQERVLKHREALRRPAPRHHGESTHEPR
jgi:aryl carrier-like protein